MAQQGWISVRNVPVVKPEGGVPEAQVYYNRLLHFFSRHTLCPSCQGDGAMTREKRPVKNAIIKFRGISELEILYLKGSLPMADIIRGILALELEGHEVCKTCNGRRFIRRPRAR